MEFLAWYSLVLLSITVLLNALLIGTTDNIKNTPEIKFWRIVLLSPVLYFLSKNLGIFGL